MLADTQGKNLNQYVADYCIFDLETTGISCMTDAVVEISAVKVINGCVVDEFSTLVNPGRMIPFAASSVNGITDDMVEDAPNFRTALKDFLDFVGDSILVGHNIHSFDMKFLWRDAMAFWGKTIANDYVDTLQLARRYLPGQKSYKLTSLAEYYGISAQGAHRALNDCRMNQQIYERLAEEMANPSEEAKSASVCPRCGCPMVKRSGRYGEFYGCTGYPQCRYTQNV